jgi:hypothetical protein
MLSRQKKFLFIHVPKTGGNSIQSIFSAYSEDQIVGNPEGDKNRFELRSSDERLNKHSTISTYESVMKDNEYACLYKFATIRNPWDWIVSFYFSPHRQVEQYCREEFKKFIMTVPPIRYWIYNFNLFEKVTRKLGFPMCVGSLDRDIDFLIRMEHLQADFDKVCNTLNLPRHKLPHKNVSSRKHYSKYYDNELIDIVAKRYSDEIKWGGYKFEANY